MELFYVIWNSKLDVQGSLIHPPLDLDFILIILTWEGLDK